MKQPLQPVVKDEKGVLRFQENKIVSFLLDWASSRGMSLNDLGWLEFDAAERRQFAQLIGYSVAGYHELPYVRDVDARAATEAAREIDETFMACRDLGCTLHCVAVEDDAP